MPYEPVTHVDGEYASESKLDQMQENADSVYSREEVRLIWSQPGESRYMKKTSRPGTFPNYGVEARLELDFGGVVSAYSEWSGLTVDNPMQYRPEDYEDVSLGDTALTALSDNTWYTVTVEMRWKHAAAGGSGSTFDEPASGLILPFYKTPDMDYCTIFAKMVSVRGLDGWVGRERDESNDHCTTRLAHVTVLAHRTLMGWL